MRNFRETPPIVGINTADGSQGLAQPRMWFNIDLSRIRIDPIQVCGEPGGGKRIGGL